MKVEPVHHKRYFTILNCVIFVSLIGIVSISIKDIYFKKRDIRNTTQKISGKENLANEIKPAACDSAFFPMNKGVVWKYKAIAKRSGIEKKPNENVSFDITGELISTSPSSITLETHAEDEKKEKVKIYCKQNGLYGFPIIPQTSSYKSILSFIDMEKLLFIPHDLGEKNSWETKLPLGSIASFLDIAKVKLNYQTVSASPQFIFGTQRETYTIKVTIQMDSENKMASGIPGLENFFDSKNTYFEYTVAQGLGLVDGNFVMSSQKTGMITISINLEDFDSGSRINVIPVSPSIAR